MTRPDYRSWRERLAATGGGVPSRVRYTRKSTEGEDRQVASHEQQGEAADREWGAIDDTWCWEDSCTGITFERPAFQDLLAFCRENRRSKAAPGRVEIYDPSRFGRTLDADGQPDIMGFQSVYSEFERYHWQIHFVVVKRTGDQLVDMITMALYAYAAALFSPTLSKSVRRGRVNHARNGWWTNGRAPWGARRKDTKTGRILKDGEGSTPGGGGTILVPDKPILKIWARAARRILSGVSLDAVGADLFDAGVRGPRGGRLGHRSIRNFLTNPALVARVEYREEEKDGKRQRVQVAAKWEPMVDENVFAQVAARLGGHSLAPRGDKRRRRERFPLTPICAHCGGKYVGGKLAEAQGGTRQYLHVKPKARMDEDGRRRFDQAGCKVWYVDADELESKVRDAILQQRTSREFEDEVRKIILDRDGFRKAASEDVEDAEREVRQREAAYGRLARLAAAVVGPDTAATDDDALLRQLKDALQTLQAAKSRVEEAKRFAASRENAWDRVSAIIHETRNIAKAWAKASPEDRKVILDYWVLDILIVVEPIPGMKRANTKTALVALRTAPGTPIKIEFGGGQAPAAAITERSSSATAASSSKGKRARKGAKAAAEPMAPSARATCMRTKGSGSAKATTSPHFSRVGRGRAEIDQR